MMKAFGKRFAVLFIAIMASVVIGGCSSQGGASTSADSSGSSGASSLSKEEMLAELDKSMATPYKSVTVDGVMAVDAGNPNASPQVPFLAKMDLSGDKTRMYMSMTMSGMTAEIFAQGDEARAIIDGAETTASPADLGIAGMSSPEELMNSFGGNFVEHPDWVTDISKEYDGDIAVYTMSLDTAKTAEGGGEQGTKLLGTPTGVPEDAKITIRVDKQGHIAGLNVNATMSGAGMSMVTRWYDYDKTAVPYFPGSDEEKNANTDKDAVYEMSEAVNYGFEYSGPTYVIYRNDSDTGNVLEYMTLVNNGNGNEVVLARYCSEYDGDGWQTGQHVYRFDNDEELVSTTLDTEKDDQGRAVKIKALSSNSGESTISYEYHANGAVKSSVTENASGATSTEEYDEDGFRIRQARETAQGTVEVRFTWEKDADGLPVGYKAEMNQNGQLAGEWAVDVTTDAAGNIIQSVNRDTGKIITRAYWTKVENPNQHTKLFAEIRR